MKNSGLLQYSRTTIEGDKKEATPHHSFQLCRGQISVKLRSIIINKQRAERSYLDKPIWRVVNILAISEYPAFQLGHSPAARSHLLKKQNQSKQITMMYYQSVLRRVHIMLKTSTNFTRYLYSREPVRHVFLHRASEKLD